MTEVTLFIWQAVDNAGNMQHGELLAASKEDIMQQLFDRELLPVTWRKRKTWHARHWKWSQKIAFMRQLATLLKAGLPLSEGLRLLADGHPHPGWRALLNALQTSVLKGEAFSAALRQWPQIFPPLWPALMQVGELTGQLDECCYQLAQQQARQQLLWQKVRKALRYPLFILLVATGVTLGMLLLVLPEFVAVYSAFNAPLPAFTSAVMALSQGLQRHGWLMALLILLPMLGWRKLHKDCVAWQRREQRGMLRLPLIAPLWRGSQLSQIFAILQLTQKAGLTLLQSLQAAEETLTPLIWREAIHDLQQHIAQGLPLYQALEQHILFTPLCYQLIRTGEEAGALDEMLARLAEWHEGQTLARAENLAAGLEPMMMVVIGIIVGTLVIAMYLPVFGLGEVIR